MTVIRPVADVPRNWHSNCLYMGRPLISALGLQVEDVNAFTATRVTLWQHRLTAPINGGKGQGRQKRLGSSFANQTVS